MANTIYNGATTKVHLGGANSDQDIHLEVYKNEVDTRFQYEAIFKGLSSQRSTGGNSTTYRIDRMGSSVVKGRKSGIALDATKVTNERVLFIVDTVLYIRNPIDYQDDWTSPDWLAEMGQNNGSQFAEMFDNAHIIALIKGRSWTAPTHLKPAFQDGAEVTCVYKDGVVTEAEERANAIALGQAHKKGVELLINRKTPLGDMVTLVSSKIYSTLLEHPKLLNKDFSAVAGGDYAGRRVVTLNGIPVVEVVCFPTAVETAHPLGSAFNVAALDITCQMVTFSKTKTLVTVEAHPFVTRVWNNENEFCNILDAYAMYTVGQRRPDTCVVTRLVAA